MTRPIELIREGNPSRPELDTAISALILTQVAAGTRPETLRIHRPGRNVAFGRRELHLSGYEAAVTVARQHGFEATERLAGGRAAVFHPETIAIGWVIPAKEPRRGIDARFDEIAQIVRSALLALGIDARIGEVAGEYCPGSHSINASGRRKLFGVGQRIVSGAAHIGGVLVVGGEDEIRRVLIPVYEALEFEWRPDTTGDLEGSGLRGGYDDVVAGVISAFNARYELSDISLDDETISLATETAPRYLSPNSSTTRFTESEPGSISDM